ncbi:thioredoxin family protein [Aurantibacillus circumpalustris]|uniref:thioredoxin family protein n=1 Tax=Aurantibacillus circumpalustris TaxID=3036359 RepID=UPI00295B4C8C|nr:thioredoxin family protein [Aurantibacillus circumpalustris]
MITQELLNQAMSYSYYKALLENLLTQGKTTGANQSAEYLNYAKINLQRMHRLEKTIVLNNELENDLSKITKQYTFLIITEGWCGDAAQNLPICYLIEKACKNITLKLILRDENLDIMNNYLTNGAKAIPKLICVNNDTLQEVFVWGPRPTNLQELVLQMKRENKTHEDISLISQNWYNADKTKTLQMEILNLVQNL